MEKKEWDKDITVSFACKCLNKVESILDNRCTKSIKCSECGEQFYVHVRKWEDYSAEKHYPPLSDFL
jgi:hypothetical protein